ncbi:GTP pyrophosphokinase family protein [Clostridium sp. D2Q-14]|uniref:GTP pyrophosphokinase n=1 Tax=Anaeromonas gelatinilytica TaxID=2683194 RepID=UPI001BB4165E|nr:GTP pyrophosphokinase family protein [Anaeromonas gelatinilytica]MBS4534159.1 GTP pyrophosphokinase family protein [Anaeromonas gelatinilytica]
MTEEDMVNIKEFRMEMTRFMMQYKFALNEINTKIDILKQEFQYIHEYNPIEHVKSRIKTPESILKKIRKKGCEFSLDSIKENIKDIAGVRITVSFISDIYKLSDMLQSQEDIETIRIKDYIKNPKPNGYKSLHLVLQVPIFMSDRVENVCVEVQIRTIAMDFWASLEHKIYYKFNKAVPQVLLDELKDAADSVAKLDREMEDIHNEIDDYKEKLSSDDESQQIIINNKSFLVPNEFLYDVLKNEKK